MKEVEACVGGNLPAASGVQTVELHTSDRTGAERGLEGELKWKRLAEGRSGWLLVIDAPPDMRESAYLMLEAEDGEEMFVYLPELKRTRRIHPNAVRGSLFGTDFSYEDMKYLLRIGSQSPAERLPDVVEDERELYVVQVSPPPDEGSAHARVVGFVDQSSCVPLRIEFYEKSGERVKILIVDRGSVSREGAGWLARSVAMKDLRKESTTRLVVSRVELDADLADRLFTVTALERGN